MLSAMLCCAGILYAQHDDKRSSTFQNVLSCGEAYLKETKVS